MKTPFTLLFVILLHNLSFGQKQSQVVSTDINNFWNAYDRIVQTKDTVQQRHYLNELFIDKGTPGLKALMQVRDYTPTSYLDAIKNYPMFWQSVRANTLKAKTYSAAINNGINQLRKLYPKLKPAIIYFTIGALKTNGTTLQNQVLIGSELALADGTTNTEEFPSTLNHLKSFFKTNPAQNVVFGNIHEYVHTQQTTTVASTLLGQCVLEGVAEFLAVQATGRPSATPALGYGPEHNNRIKQVFAEEMFNPDNSFWLYSNQANEFNQRDLGYYVGYAICRQYYNSAGNKPKAVKDMIELDYNNLSTLIKFVDQSGYFNQPLSDLYKTFEATRPKIVSVNEIPDPAKPVSHTLQSITVNFSAPMNVNKRGFEIGPLGEANLMRVKRFLGFSADGKSASFEVELKPGRRYQLLLSDRFQDTSGKPLQPYLIDFSTLPQN